METVSVVEFSKTAGMYRAGDMAGFDPDLARKYEERGFGRVVRANVPKVEAAVVTSDVRRRLDEMRGKLAGAEAAAKAAKAAGDQSADEALAEIAAVRAQLAATEKAVAAGATMRSEAGTRRPAASTGAI